MTGADLANLVNEAALLAARRGQDAVSSARSDRRAREGAARHRAQRRHSRRASDAAPRTTKPATRCSACCSRAPIRCARCRSFRAAGRWASRCPRPNRIATATTPTTCAAGSSARWAAWPPSRRCSTSSPPAAESDLEIGHAHRALDGRPLGHVGADRHAVGAAGRGRSAHGGHLGRPARRGGRRGPPDHRRVLRRGAAAAAGEPRQARRHRRRSSSRTRAWTSRRSTPPPASRARRPRPRRRLYPAKRPGTFGRRVYSWRRGLT